MLQDMKKVFDSVSLQSLNLALQRIKVPWLRKKFILELFNKRQMRIITALGLTEAVVAGDSIEQREVISPLVWRIFYDPLLTRVQNDPSLGYVAEVSWQTSLEKRKEETQRQGMQ